MVNMITPGAPEAFAMDVLGIAPEAAIPAALIIQCSTRAAVLEGDAVWARIPLINLDDDVAPVREGDEIPVADPNRSEAIVRTVKVGELVKASREQLVQPAVQDLLTNEMRRALTYKADAMFAAQAAPVAPETWPPAGLLPRATDAGDIIDNLDAVVDAVAAIESTPGGVATHIIAHPLAYAEVRKYKTATDSEVSLVGAGTEAGPKTLLSLPVLTNSALPEDKIIVLDRYQVLSAYGDLTVESDKSAYFTSDSIAVKGIFRFGLAVKNAGAVQVLTVPDETP